MWARWAKMGQKEDGHSGQGQGQGPRPMKYMLFLGGGEAVCWARLLRFCTTSPTAEEGLFFSVAQKK